MERWMIVFVLPLEVWMDIFCFPWISRKEFGQIVARIGNFKFAEHAQFFLHEWGKRKLGRLFFEQDGLCKYANRKPYRLDIPQTPMPENIKSFDYIEISHFDANTLDFLAAIKPLLTDLELHLSYMQTSRLENVYTILTIMSPMLDIQSLQCADQTTLPVVRQFFSIEGFANRLKKLRITIFHANETERRENVAFIVNWLTQPDIDGPRLLEFRSDYRLYEQIFSAIHEQFHAAKIPHTFAVNLELDSWQERRVAEFHLENKIGEALHGKWIDSEHMEVFQITRHRADRSTQEIREWIMAMTKGREDRKIWILNPTVGRIDAAPQMAVPRMDEEHGDQQQKPCSSKDA